MKRLLNVAYIVIAISCGVWGIQWLEDMRKQSAEEARLNSEAAMDKALELADKLSRNGPLAVRKIKEGVIRSSGLPLEQALQIENEVSAAVMSSKDAREGPRAFKEKRAPRFTGE